LRIHIRGTTIAKRIFVRRQIARGRRAFGKSGGRKTKRIDENRDDDGEKDDHRARRSGDTFQRMRKNPPQQSAAHLISLAYQLRMKPYFPQLADHSETDDPILAERLQHRQEHLIR
jgi:hypothetical protein